MSGEVIVGAVAVTLDRTAKVQRDKFVQTLGLSSRVPLKEHIFTRSMRHPQITLIPDHHGCFRFGVGPAPGTMVGTYFCSQLKVGVMTSFVQSGLSGYGCASFGLFG